MTTTPASGFAAGLVLQHRYRLDEALVPGPMAEVWNGHDLVLKRPVAIKLLHPHLATDPDLVQRFRREAVAAARLAHPNIVPTYDTGTDEDVAYIILGLVHGPSLAEFLQQETTTEAAALDIARQVAEAITHAHQAGIVHQDINPTNVFVVGEDRRVLVTDFGLAKAVADASEHSPALASLTIGSAQYHAPEQGSGADDPRVDIYAVGALLREMIPDPSEKARPILEKATSPNADDRYQSASDLLAALVSVSGQAPGAVSFRAAQKLPPPKPPRHARELEDATQAHVQIGNEEITAPHAPVTGQIPSMQSRAVEQPVDQPSDDAVPQNSRHESRASFIKIASIAFAVFLVVVAVLLGLALNQASAPSNQTTQTTQNFGTALAITSANAFDPIPGDGEENNAQLPNVVDGNASTGWSTDTYATSTFGNLKTGVGLVLNLNSSSALRSLQVDGGGIGWSAQIYVADASSTTLRGWGDVVDNQSGLGGSARFDLHGATGSRVLIWITDLGTGNRLSVNEVSVTA